MLRKNKAGQYAAGAGSVPAAPVSLQAHGQGCRACNFISVKTTVEIRPDTQGIYTGTIKTISPRVGSQLQETCTLCPIPHTNQRLVGLKTITGLKHVSGSDYAEGQILDPISGKQQSLKAKLSASGNRLNLQGFSNNIAGRTQAWIRVK